MGRNGAVMKKTFFRIQSIVLPVIVVMLVCVSGPQLGQPAAPTNVSETQSDDDAIDDVSHETQNDDNTVDDTSHETQTNAAAPKGKKPVRFEFKGFIGTIRGFQGSDVIVYGNDTIGILAPIGKVLVVDADGERIYLQSTFPMQTVVRSKVIRGNRAHLKIGMKVYLDSHEIQSDDAGDDETETETEPVSPKDSTVTETDKDSFKNTVCGILGRQSIGVAFSYMDLVGFNEPGYFTYENGSLVRKDINGGNKGLIGIAFQYHFWGRSFINGTDWRGNSLLGISLLLDGSLNYGTYLKIAYFGIGLELQFLWIFKAAWGMSIVRSDEKVFGHSGDANDGFETLPVKDKKLTQFMFFQAGISVPVYNEYDVFALFDLRPELLVSSGQVFTSFRAGVAYKF